VTKRIRSERGLGLIELLIALTIMQIAIFALYAAFNAGAFAILRSSRVTAASVVADKQMELYRGLRYADVGLSPAEVLLAAADSTHIAETVEWNGGTQVAPDPLSTWCVSPKPECSPIRASVTGPDNQTYRVDTYIRSVSIASGESVKRVTVAVRRSSDLTARPLAHVASTFHRATGCVPGAAAPYNC
jgi:Tfp pilus assembly protein PilV